MVNLPLVTPSWSIRVFRYDVGVGSMLGERTPGATSQLLCTASVAAQILGTSVMESKAMLITVHIL